MADTKHIKHAIRQRYAWPGGYPLYGITSDGCALCVTCMREHWHSIAYAVRHDLRDGWYVSAIDINYEDVELHCEHCTGHIEAAYA
jgi:hypothetical protein